MPGDRPPSLKPDAPVTAAAPCRAPGPVALAPEMAALAQNGAAIAVASCTPDGHPVIGLGAGCRLTGDGRLRILLSRAANLRLVEAILAGGAVAVTFTATRDHSSFQVKAAAGRLSDNCADDRPETGRQAALLCDGLVELGFSREQAAGYTAYDPETLVSIELCPERVFSQTPGPGAGAELPT